MSPQDITGCLGLALLIALFVALVLTWPGYPKSLEWDEHARQQTVARLTKGT